MSVFHGTDGAVLAVNKRFVDDDEAPIMVRPGYPVIRLKDAEKNILVQTIGSPSSVPGTWEANIAVPNMGLEETTEFRLTWVFKDTSNEKTVETDLVLLEPKTDQRVSDIVEMFGTSKFAMTLPLYVGDDAEAKYQIYTDNIPGVADDDLMSPTIKRTTAVDRTSFLIPMAVPAPSLRASLLMAQVTPNGALMPKTFTYKLWAITPQIGLAMSMLVDFLDKAKVSNVIPELRYTSGDLILYLERGLNLFNMVQQPSSFNGLNMQGVILDAWVTCASYYALGAQLMAEGALAFDFSGQGISLNVDRTPQLEAALGRIESQINDRVVPLKKYLWKQNITSGDGSIGSKNMNNPSSFGVLEISNSPTTRLNGMTGFTGRRGWGW